MGNFENLTAVVADDHELFRQACGEMLRRELGFRSVVEVASLDAAIDHLARAPNTALVSVDLSMPGMHGANSIYGLRKIYSNLRLVVVTGSERPEDILAALGAGAHGFIPKTLRVSEITAALRMVMEGKIFVPPSLAMRRPSVGSAIVTTEVIRSPQSFARSADLSLRQCDVMRLMTQGLSNKQIANALHLAEGTVKVHIHAAFRTLGVNNRTRAAAAFTQFETAGQRATNYTNARGP